MLNESVLVVALFPQERKFVGGSGQISDRMAGQLGDGVRLNQPAVRLTQTEAAVYVETLHGDKYEVGAREGLIHYSLYGLCFQVHSNHTLPVTHVLDMS